MPSRFLQAAEWNLEVLSPLHIGSGDRLSPLDYATHTEKGKRLLVVYDFAALGVTDPQKLQEMVRFVQGGREWNELRERAREFGAERPEDAIRYMLPMLAQGKAEEVAPFVRNAEDYAYVPGSSLKGAIRTALLYQWAIKHPQEFKQRVTGAVHGEKRVRAEFAAGDLEKGAFGRDPNHDALRALRVADSAPHAYPGSGTFRPKEAVLRAERLGEAEGSSEALRLWLEALLPGAKLRLRITLDSHLFTPQAEPELHLGNWRAAIEDWPAACRRFSADLLESQAQMLDRLGKANGAKWCRDLKNEAERRTAGCLLPIGWGVGWEGKTIGMLMEDEAYAEVKARFELARGKDHASANLDGIFPATRWAVNTNQGPLPLGWVRLAPHS
jgi:CRISPR-associated protein Csm5